MSFTKIATLESAQILDIKGSQQRSITASLEKIGDFDDYRTEDGYLYARIRAISSRVNKNHDGWPSVELAGNEEIFDRYAGTRSSFSLQAGKGEEFGFSTFLGKPIFVDHHNSDPSRARGVIVDAKLHVEDRKTSGLDSYYSSAPDNHLPPTWVELLLEVDAKAFPKLAAAILEGSKNPRRGIDGFSMGCDVEKTKCNICSKYAYSPEDYCEHVRLKGAHFDHVDPKTGHKTSKKSYEDCYGIKFFEISAVFDPADETALLRELIHKEAGGYDQWLEKPYMKDEEACPECGTGLETETNGANCPQCGWTAGYDGPDRHEDVEPDWDREPGGADFYSKTAKTSDDQEKLDAWLADKEPEEVDTKCPRCGKESGIGISDTSSRCTSCGGVLQKAAHVEQAILGAGDVRDGMRPYPVWHGSPHSLLTNISNAHPEGGPTLNGVPWEQMQPGHPALGGIQNTEPLPVTIEHPDNRMTQIAKVIVEHPGNPNRKKSDIQQILQQPRVSKIAEAPLPQSEQLHAPEEIDTLRDEQVCPVCGSTMDEETCDLCGYVKPPDGFDNPDLSQAKERKLEGEIDQPGAEQDPGMAPPQQVSDVGLSEPDIGKARNNSPTANVKNDMAKWKISVHPKVAARINITESPITTGTEAETDEPKEEILSDETQPTTSRTAREFIAAANKENKMSKQAAEPVPAARPDVSTEVEGVGGVDQASNEQASKADGQVKLDPQGGTGVEDVSADQEGVNVDQGDEHSKNVEEIPTKTWSGEKGQTSPVQGDVFPTAARTALDSEAYPKDDGGLGGGNATQGVKPADPVGTADDRVDVLDAVTSPENNSGPTDTWSGTDGNGVLRQQDPVTNETLEGDNIVNLNPGKSSKHLFSSFKLADLEVELGLLDPSRKYDRVAELEQKSEESVTASLEYAQRVKTAGLGRQVKEARRLPSLTQPPHDTKSSSSESSDDDDESALFL